MFDCWKCVGWRGEQEWVCFLHFGAIGIYYRWLIPFFHLVHSTPAIRNGSFPFVQLRLYRRKTDDGTLAHKDRVYLLSAFLIQIRDEKLYNLWHKGNLYTFRTTTRSDQWWYVRNKSSLRSEDYRTKNTRTSIRLMSTTWVVCQVNYTSVKDCSIKSPNPPYALNWAIHSA